MTVAPVVSGPKHCSDGGAAPDVDSELVMDANILTASKTSSASHSREKCLPQVTKSSQNQNSEWERANEITGSQSGFLDTDGDSGNIDEIDINQWSDPDVPLSKDGGYGWVIVFASFFNAFIIDGVGSCFGLIFPHVMSRFGSTAFTTSWAGSLFVSFLIMGSISAALVRKFGYRLVSITGGILACSSVVLSAFSSNIGVFILTYGLLAGCSCGLVFLPSVVIVNDYFHERRGLANGIITSGSGAGLLVLAPLVNYLLDKYALEGTLLMIAGILLHMSLFSTLYRPLKGSKPPINGNIDDIKTSSEKVNDSTDSGHISHSGSFDTDPRTDREQHKINEGKNVLVDETGVHLLDVEERGAVDNLSLDGGTKRNAVESHELDESFTIQSDVAPIEDFPHSVVCDDEDIEFCQISGREDGCDPRDCKLLTQNSARTSEKAALLSHHCSDTMKPNETDRLYRKVDPHHILTTERTWNSSHHLSSTIPPHGAAVKHASAFDISVSDKTTPHCGGGLVSSIRRRGLPLTVVECRHKSLKNFPRDHGDHYHHHSHCDFTNISHEDVQVERTSDSTSVLCQKSALLNQATRIRNKHNLLPLIQQCQYFGSNNYLSGSLSTLRELHIKHLRHQEDLGELTTVLDPKGYPMSRTLVTQGSKSHPSQNLSHESRPHLSLILKSDGSRLRIPPHIPSYTPCLLSETNLSCCQAPPFSSEHSLAQSTLATHNFVHPDSLSIATQKYSGEQRIAQDPLEIDDNNFEVLMVDKELLLYNTNLSLGRLIRLPCFILFCIGSCLIQVGYPIAGIFLADLAYHQGCSESQVALLMGVLGGSNVVGRLLSGALANFGVKPLRLLSIPLVLGGVTCLLAPFYTSYWLLLLFAALFGFLLGFFPPVQPLVIVEYFGLGSLTPAFGLLTTLKGLSTILGPPLAGSIYDISGQYPMSFVFGGATFILSAAVHCLMPYFRPR